MSNIEISEMEEPEAEEEEDEDEEEMTSWAQTLITVTPQEDGLLREFADKTVVSGVAKVPLKFDTSDITFRRSLIDTSRHLIDKKELEGNEGLVDNECQTYLQGVPIVELPTIYKDQAIQTLFMGGDDVLTAQECPYRRMIAVLNDAILPQLMTSQRIQTEMISEEDPGASLFPRILQFEDKDETEVGGNESADDSLMESLDILNYIVQRSLWMSTGPIPRPILESSEVQTFLKYNHVTGEFSIDQETQTRLSCRPISSDSMLLAEYNDRKEICKEIFEIAMDHVIYPRILVDEIFHEILERIQPKTDFPADDETFPGPLTDRRCPAITGHCPVKSKKCGTPILPNDLSLQATNFPNFHEQKLNSIPDESRDNLPTEDENALRMFKNVFCRNKKCPNRTKK